MNMRAPCESCGAKLAMDQRYCVECGARVGPPLALPYLSSLPVGEQGGGARFVLPVPIQMATTFAALALGFGVVVGTAISPDLSNIVASPAPIVAQTPPTEAPAPPATGGAAPAPSSTPTSTIASTTPSVTGTSGGGHKKKKKQPSDLIPIDGTVVQVNSNAVTFAVEPNGGGTEVKVVHTDRPDQLPVMGSALVTKARLLFNKTYYEVGPRTLQGAANTLTISGTVTYTDVGEDNTTDPSDSEAYTISSGGASLPVLIPTAGTVTASTEDPPPLYSFVTVPVEIPTVGAVTGAIELTPAPTFSGPCTQPPTAFKPPTPFDHVLVQGGPTPAPTNPSVSQTGIEAIVQASCPGVGLTASADDIRQRGVDMSLAAGGLDMAMYTPGESIVANVALGGSTTPRITGIASDQGLAGANDNLKGQGDLAGPPVDISGSSGKKKKKKKKK